jgi:DNA ligase D-like protein (predicted 3'-phosphoesterase)
VAKRERNQSLQAVRARVGGELGGDGPALRDAIIGRARELGLLGWARDDSPDGVRVHAEGAPEAVAALVTFLEPMGELATEPVKTEGHEQFAARGVPAGAFVVQEHQASTHHFDLRLEVDGVMRSWAVPKGPSLDPGVKRLAVQVPDHDTGHNTFEGPGHGGGVIVWDRGTYEQGGRVPWPEALDRGHAVFVLHGEKLRGGFALQRTRPVLPPQWLLIKRRDADARPGSDIASEKPLSVVSGRALDEVIGDEASGSAA